MLNDGVDTYYGDGSGDEEYAWWVQQDPAIIIYLPDYLTVTNLGAYASDGAGAPAPSEAYAPKLVTVK